MAYKALILDLDGTTVPIGSIHPPSPRVVQAITKAAQNVFVGVATGRPYFFAKYILDHLPLTAPLILNGGAQLYDPIHKSVVWEKQLPLEELERLHIIVKGMGLLLKYNDGMQDYILTDGVTIQTPFNASIEGLDETIADQLIAKTTSLPHLAFHKVPSILFGKIDLDISHVSATKQHGIYEVAKRLGIHTDEIIGVGDSGNDLPLLMACGLKVAMGNAVEDLKAIADYVAPSVDEEGVVEVIERFILKPQSDHATRT